MIYVLLGLAGELTSSGEAGDEERSAVHGGRQFLPDLSRDEDELASPTLFASILLSLSSFSILTSYCSAPLSSFCSASLLLSSPRLLGLPLVPCVNHPPQAPNLRLIMSKVNARRSCGFIQ